MATKTYARIADGAVVAELVTLDATIDIAAAFHRALVFVDVTGLSPQPAQGWHYTAPATFTAPPAPPAPTLADQARAAAVGGITLTLSGSITLAATLFPTDAVVQAKLGAVVTTLVATGAFPGGESSYPLRDDAGDWHVLTAAQYKAIAGAIAAFVAACDLIADGNPLAATELPANSISLTL